MNATRLLSFLLLIAFTLKSSAQISDDRAYMTLSRWQMQDVTKVAEPGATVSNVSFHPAGWYRATVPGTVLTTLVDNRVYPEPLYGENMRAIPESLNKTRYWYRTTFTVPAEHKGRHTWLEFGGINYSSQVWVNGTQVGTTRGAFIRGRFDITSAVRPGRPAAVAVLVSPQPHPGVPHEHNVANGVGKNGGVTAIDGPTFLSTIGWDWLPAVRDRDTGLWLPVTVWSTGPVVVKDPYVTADLAANHESADLHVSVTLDNMKAKPLQGTLIGTISGQGADVVFSKEVSLSGTGLQTITLDSAAAPELRILQPKLWWPNGYGAPNLYTLKLRFEAGKEISDATSTKFGIRSIQYQVAGSDNLTLVVNGVKIMARGGNWGLDEGLKRMPRERLEAQIRMHAIANLNMIRNWVGQSTNPDFYDLADKYGIMLWDEFFQPNPNDGPDVEDVPTYLENVTDKVLRFRNHPSIVIWCARNEGRPPKQLDDALASLMSKLDPERLYQSSSTDGRGVASHGPYYWRSPRFFYPITEAFKTETGSVSVPTIESIQGMMPKKDWETVNDDWAQHDMASGAQRGNEYPFTIAQRYGRIRNLADFVRKSQLANYEAFRAMYEGRNTKMFTESTGVITWMSHPAQPSFVWQLYHYDLEPNSALYAAKKANESIHVQFNEANRDIEVVNNLPHSLTNLKLEQTVYRLDGTADSHLSRDIAEIPASSTRKLYTISVSARITPVYFIKLDLLDATGKLLSTNFYWQNVAQDDFHHLADMPTVKLSVQATAHANGENTIVEVVIKNPSPNVALMTHLQLHDTSGKRVLPVFYSDNYLSLVPGETRSVTVEAAARDIAGEPVLLVDGYNVDLLPPSGPVAIRINENAQPTHWPASDLVPGS